MKRTLVVAVLAVILFAGCESVGNIFNPIVGTWESSIWFPDQVIDFERDGDVRQTDSIGDIGGTKEGNWTSNDSTITITWDDASSDVYSYNLNSNNSELTLTQSGGSRTYDRQ